ncbi:MAG: NAD(P)/FAD-dependent oxidoreductase [Myxococcales bacterium]|nr:NAD(P)/FAD-dependent oxidoreductase [Myxococcales bacterium]
MPNSRADVIVAGGGPLGAYAAWQFAARGLEVLVLENRSEKQDPSDVGVFHFERIAFDRTGVPLPPPKKVVCTYPGVTLHAPDPRFNLQVDDVETWAMDLSPFIRDLRAMAVIAGAEFQYGALVTDVVREGGRIAGVRARVGKTEREFRAPVVVDATGLARAVRRHAPDLNEPGADRCFSVYMEYWEQADPPLPDGIHSYMGANAWTARYPGYWVVGMGKPVPMEALKILHADWVRAHHPGARRIRRVVAGAIPYAFPPATLVDDGLLVLGDAAATNKPFNGEGIASGMVLARLAAEVLPAAVKAGGTRAALWEINRRYFGEQGAKFAFLQAMGFSLLTLNEAELNTAVEIGLVTARDLQQTFYHYEVKKPLAEWLLPVTRLLRRTAMARKYGAAIYRAVRVGNLFQHYPSPERFAAWRDGYRRLVVPLQNEKS